MDELNREIEKWWRDKFAEEIESSMMADLADDQPTYWFNKGMKHAALIVRYTRDEQT